MLAQNAQLNQRIIRSGQVWGHTPEQRVAASTLRRYSFGEKDNPVLSVLSTDIKSSISKRYPVFIHWNQKSPSVAALFLDAAPRDGRPCTENDEKTHDSFAAQIGTSRSRVNWNLCFWAPFPISETVVLQRCERKSDSVWVVQGEIFRK